MKREKGFRVAGGNKFRFLHYLYRGYIGIILG